MSKNEYTLVETQMMPVCRELMEQKLFISPLCHQTGK